MYYSEFIDSENVKESILFTGDCIFYGGVGMFFEGTPKYNINVIYI